MSYRLLTYILHGLENHCLLSQRKHLGSDILSVGHFRPSRTFSLDVNQSEKKTGVNQSWHDILSFFAILLPPFAACARLYILYWPMAPWLPLQPIDSYTLWVEEGCEESQLVLIHEDTGTGVDLGKKEDWGKNGSELGVTKAIRDFRQLHPQKL